MKIKQLIYIRRSSVLSSAHYSRFGSLDSGQCRFYLLPIRQLAKDSLASASLGKSLHVMYECSGNMMINVTSSVKLAETPGSLKDINEGAFGWKLGEGSDYTIPSVSHDSCQALKSW